MELVEAAGIEPASENSPLRLSTSVDYGLNSPLACAHSQAHAGVD